MNLKKFLTKLIKPGKKRFPTFNASYNVRESDMKYRRKAIVNQSEVVATVSESNKNILNPEQQVELCVMLGEHVSNTDIIAHFKANYDIGVSQQMCSFYKTSENWKPLIKSTETKYLADIGSVSGSHKKVRLERYERIYDENIELKQYDPAMKATESQRVEIEGKTPNPTFNQFNQYNLYSSMSDDDLLQERDRLLKRVIKTKEVDNGTGSIKDPKGD